jgi:putative tricarboxylic transport membrane protein
MYGLQPGPLLFQDNPQLVWAIVASMYVGNVVLLILNLPLVGLFVKLLEIPTSLLFPGVLAFVVLGAYALSFSISSLLLLLVFGVIGYLMQQYDFPLAPAVLGLVLEPLLETNLRRATQITGGDVTVFAERPISLALLVVVALVLATPLISMVRARRRTATSAASAAGASPAHEPPEAVGDPEAGGVRSDVTDVHRGSGVN